MRHSSIIRVVLSVAALLAAAPAGRAQVPNCLFAGSFEPNDQCLFVQSIDAGLTVGLTAQAFDSDDYFYTVPAGKSTTFDILSFAGPGDLRAALYDDLLICNNEVDSSITPHGSEQVVYTNATTNPVIVVLCVLMPELACVDYSINITTIHDSCLSSMEDALAPNHSCATATPVAPGTLTGLAIHHSAGEGDFFSIDVAPYATLNVDVLFETWRSDIDCYLYDEATFPGNLIQGGSMISSPFKDGILCAGFPTERVEVVSIDASGTATTSSSIATATPIVPGDIRWYQVWYRDPAVSPCGSGSNLSSGLAVVFTP